MKIRRIALAGVLTLVTLASFTGAAPAARDDSQALEDLTIAYQPGIGYTPLILMKQLRLIEKRYPGTKVDWKVLSSGTPITNGVIAGDIDIGAVGVGPFLTGWARGVGWKILSPLNLGDLWLMARDANIRTIADLRGKRIATPTNTSIQAVALRKMAQVKLGDARALDSGLLAMDHPDGLQALMTGQIDAHFTSAPFQFQEKTRGAHVIARSYQYFGAHSFLVTVAQQKLFDENAAFARWFYGQIGAMEKLIEKNPTRVAKILQDDADGTPTWRQFKQWLAAKVPNSKMRALEFSTRPVGLVRTARFMYNTQQLTKMPGGWKELVFPPVQREKGS